MSALRKGLQRQSETIAHSPGDADIQHKRWFFRCVCVSLCRD
jgi:hypothetical protein